MLNRAFAVATILAASAACIPVDGDIAPCGAEGACLPGYHCDVGFCLPVDALAVEQGIGPEGGEVEGPDGALLLVPPGAVTENTKVTLNIQSSGTVINGAQVLTHSYTVEPEGLSSSSPRSS